LSYTSFKRVLGETSLERKCRFLFGACLLILITSSFWWYGSRTEELVYANRQNFARSLIPPILAQIHWEKLEKFNHSTVAEAWANDLAKEWTTEQFDYRVINKNNMDPVNLPARDSLDDRLYEQFKKREPYKPPPKTVENPGLQYHNVTDALAVEDRDPQREQYLYFEPIFATKANCVNCHRNYGKSALAIAGDPKFAEFLIKEGSLIAVVKVTLPDSETQKAINWNRAILLATAIMTVFLAMIAAYVIVRYVIVKPLKHLRDVSEEVARGQFDARADIHTGDEFEELAKAFNKMVRHLVDAQEDLRQGKYELDLKVDELAQLNMRLYEMNRLKSDFLATMSHELRTPLNSIIGFSDVLSSIKALDDKQQRYVHNIQKSGRMLLDMINDILDLAKIESGKMELRLTEFRIESVISAQCDMARPLTEKKNIDLESVFDADLPTLFQDMGKVQQILNNLLSNAIKFTPEGGRITITARRDESGNDLLLDVADTGVGISPEDQSAIFEKFRQGATVLARGDAMTREYSGTGLGLSIVKELCKLLGGEIYLQSELGQGSTFTVQLPFTRSETPKLDLPAIPLTPTTAGKPLVKAMV